jgi:Flp pilus assembly protein TadG
MRRAANQRSVGQDKSGKQGRLFANKKKQKNVLPRWAMSPPDPTPPAHKRFLLLPAGRLFFKRAGLAFLGQTRATAGIEFALNGLVLFLFLFGLINLGDLGLVVSTLKHGVQSAARDAAVQTGVQIEQTDNPADCATATQIIGYFNAVTTPILPPAAAAANGADPIVQTAWANAASPGTMLTVSVSYDWVPLGMTNAFPAIPITITSSQIVMGTSGLTTSCS